jgi:hypothetical protein
MATTRAISSDEMSKWYNNLVRTYISMCTRRPRSMTAAGILYEGNLEMWQSSSRVQRLMLPDHMYSNRHYVDDGKECGCSCIQ